MYTSLATNQYYWSVVTEDFISGAPFNLTHTYEDYYNKTHPTFTATAPSTSLADSDHLEEIMSDYWADMQANASSWQRLENKDCIKKYENAFISGRRNVILVSSTKNDTNSVLMYGSSDISSAMDGNWWICSEGRQDGGFMTCNPDKFITLASNWTVFDYPIEYCLSQITKDTCSMNFSMTIMIVVLAFNTLKVFLMLWVLFRFDAEKILASVGDAAASFLTHEDPTTMRMCLADKRGIRRDWKARGFARPFDPRRRHWGTAVRVKRIVLFLLL